MQEIINTAKLVKQALTSYPKARNNDEYLYYVICQAVLRKQGINIAAFTFKSSLLDRKIYGLPKFETVRRARQKIQAECPELASVEVVSALRAEREEVFREYARG